MQPAAIALNYSVKNIRNDVRQKIIIYIRKIAIELTSVGLTHACLNYAWKSSSLQVRAMHK